MSNKLIFLGLVAITGLLVFLGSQDAEGLAHPADGALLTAFADFKSTHGKSYYSLEEAEYRLGVFRANMDLVERHNADPTQTYTLGLNQFADLTFDEFTAHHLSEDREDQYRHGQDDGLEYFSDAWSGEKKVDWREKGIVGAAKNQAACGSCWAFSAVSVVEEALSLFKETTVVLSEQELVDCSSGYGNGGCNGGLSFQGLSYIKDYGLNTEKDYPYTARDGKCKSISGHGAYKIHGWQAQPAGPQKMAEALLKQPTTASFHVQSDFRFYKTGVYNPTSCPGNRNHAVNAVGFDFEAEVPHFIVRNSWGATWGDNGFFRIAAKEGNGTCWFNGDGRTTFPLL